MRNILLFMFVFFLIGCSNSVNELPSEIKEAAYRAVPGVVLTNYEKKYWHGEEIYEVDGKLDGRVYHIIVGADGKSRGVAW